MNTTKGSASEILELYKSGKIALDEAIMWVKAIEHENESSDANKAEQKSVQEVRKIASDTAKFKKAIRTIARDTIEDFDIDKVLEIMKEKNWQYAANYDSKNNKLETESVTKERVINTIYDVINSAINCMLECYDKGEEPYGSCMTGGFFAKAWVEEGDTNIQTELWFVPYTAYGPEDNNADFDTLFDLYKKSKQQTDTGC